MTDSVVHKDRPDLAPDAVEVAIFGVVDRVFTLILSGAQMMAWVEITGGTSDNIQIAFPIDKVAHLILGYVVDERQRRQNVSNDSKRMS